MPCHLRHGIAIGLGGRRLVRATARHRAACRASAGCAAAGERGQSITASSTVQRMHRPPASVARARWCPPVRPRTRCPRAAPLGTDRVGPREVPRLARGQPLGDRGLDRATSSRTAPEPLVARSAAAIPSSAPAARKPHAASKSPASAAIRQRMHRRQRERRVQIVAQRLHHRRAAHRRRRCPDSRSSAR